MAKLLFSLEGTPLGEFPLDKERITIGRHPSNDIQIDNLAVSGEHADIKIIGKDAFLEDLGSTNGTLVNKKKVHQHILQHGDVISLGKYQLKYISDAVADAAPVVTATAARPIAANTATMVQPKPEPAKHSPATSAVKPQPAKQATSQVTGRIHILSGPNVGKVLPLNKALTTLGKSGKQVAVITKRHQGYVISHIEGRKHPLVNGKPIGIQAHPLNDHDVIELAGVTMEFSFARG